MLIRGKQGLIVPPLSMAKILAKIFNRSQVAKITVPFFLSILVREGLRSRVLAQLISIFVHNVKKPAGIFCSISLYCRFYRYLSWLRDFVSGSCQDIIVKTFQSLGWIFLYFIFQNFSNSILVMFSCFPLLL